MTNRGLNDSSVRLIKLMIILNIKALSHTDLSNYK